jgi:hypothetical protein
MNRTKKLLLNMGSTGAYHVIAMVMGFVVPKLMIHFYSSQVNGLIVSITEFFNYFKLVETGLATAAVYSLYKPLSEKNHDKINGVVSAARHFYNTTGLMFIGLTLVFALVYPTMINKIDTMDDLSVFFLVIIMGLTGALDLLTLGRYRVLLTADQKTYVISFISMLSLILQTAIIAILCVLRVDVLLMRFLAGLTILLRTVLLSLYVNKHYPFINYHAKPNKAALSNRYDALYNQLTVSLQQSLGIIMATVILRDTKLVSVYGVYHMVIVGLWSILKMVTVGIYSFFGEIIVRGDKAHLKRVYDEFESGYMALCIIIFSAAAVLIVPFIRLYAGEVTDINYIRPLWGILFVLQGFSDQLRMPLDLMVTSAGAFRQTRHHNTVQTMAAVVLGGILGYFFGVPGILIGIIISNIIRGILQLIYVPKAITGIPAKSSIKRISRAAITSVIICVPFIFLPLAPKSYLGWLFDALLVAAFASGTVLLSAWLFDRKATSMLFSRLKILLKR